MTNNPISIEGGLLDASVFHARHAPRYHAFNYNVFYLAVPVQRIPLLEKLKTISLKGFNLFGLLERDHGMGDAKAFGNWIPSILKRFDASFELGEVLLISLPRVLNFIFNPVSFWCCFDTDGALCAVVSEVNNTFNERHCYYSAHEDGRAIGKQDWLTAQKVFHVSPFMDVEGSYRFRFDVRPDVINIFIDYYVGGEKRLSTSLCGKRHALNDKNLLLRFFQYPFITMKVIVLIHFEAIRLALKRMRYFDKPQPPTTDISR
ncbi:MAG: DUF1365 domain-containing protein [Alphaproteobacteria bacterium]|nr:DUF1365 domain-containing protein [Alphaproteobacteria bacterium]